jgi:UDP-N-acetylglucosamine 2-epimerase (non-hydrolysing)
MTNRIKVMTLVGTRPELIKLSRVIAELDRHTCHVLVHSGQNYDYELNEVFFSDLDIRKPDHFLGVAGATACETIANVIVATERIIIQESPDAFLVYGDTNSCLGAIAAKRHRVPVFHMEAGNRCFDERVPEELNRRLLDHLSDINMPLTEHGRRYLLQEGIRSETVIKTGSCMQEVLEFYRQGIESSGILQQLALVEKEYFVVSAHREENVDDAVNLDDLLIALEQISSTYGKPVIFSVHPRTRQRLQQHGWQPDPRRIRILKPLGFLDYVRLQMGAYCVISDSGTVTEEAALLGFPAITIRNAHERPEGMDAGVLIMSGLQSERVLQAIAVVTAENSSQQPVDDYAAGSVSRKVLHTILSYTDYIKRTAWREQA